MSQVSEKEFFYINRKTHYSVYPLLNMDDFFKTGDYNNPFFDYYLTQPAPSFPVMHEGDTVPRRYNSLAYLKNIRDGTFKIPDICIFAGELHQAFNYYTVLCRELFWEQIRKVDFPKKPSRQKCMWLTKSLDWANYWNIRLEKNNFQSQIIKVRVTGKIHEADASFMMNDGDNLSESYKKVMQYWTGEIAEKNSDEEILFEGTGEVIEII